MLAPLLLWQTDLGSSFCDRKDDQLLELSLNNLDLLPWEQSIAGRRILVTGHTGFTGGWLSLWLDALGADVTGLSLAPHTLPNLFDAAKVESTLTSYIGNIGSYATVQSAFEESQPEIVFHLAAQPLVSRAFDDPLETFTSNIIGTANVLEAARKSSTTKAVVCVTTDKVYADQNWHWGYRETDRLGGKDPYSASKAAAEMIAYSYQSTLNARGNGVVVACARGGNIIGGGDWSENRIVPDFVRALITNSSLTIRSPDAVRPWQHVLALVHGYLILANGLLENLNMASAWNFGPKDEQVRKVSDLIESLSSVWKRPDLRIETGTFPETKLLQVDSSRSRAELGWLPPIDFASCVQMTADWYRRYQDGEDARSICLEQISIYRQSLRGAE